MVASGLVVMDQDNSFSPRPEEVTQATVERLFASLDQKGTVLRLLRYCQMRKTWAPFSITHYIVYCNGHEKVKKKEERKGVSVLVDKGYLYVSDGRYFFTLEFMKYLRSNM